MITDFYRLVEHKAKCFPLWLTRKVNAYALKNLQTALNLSIDIRTIPPARGKLRILQRADSLLLKIFDEFCRRNGFRYFLSAGTMLGAVRHKGFIPWDDDLDINLFYTDYEQVISKLEEEIKGTTFCLFGIDNVRCGDGSIRLTCADFPELNLDLDYMYPGTMSFDNKDAIRAKWKTVRKDYDRQFRRLGSNPSRNDLADLRRESDRAITDFIGLTDPENAAIFVKQVSSVFYMYKKDWILPLSTTCFENHEVSASHDTEACLRELYGDWLSFPSRFDHHGDDFLQFDEGKAEQTISRLLESLRANRFI